MKLITRQILADEAPERFAKVYSKPYTKWNEVIKQLLALPKPVDPDAVDRIIGNKSWTAVPKCHECGTEDHDAVVEVGEEPDYESNTACLCLACAQKAVDTLRGRP
jgi:hypothetical protein